MLNYNQKQKLMSNWGEKANSMSCNVELKVYDPLSSWECFVYALNPEDEDEICCIIRGFGVEVCLWSLTELSERYNVEGEYAEVDYEYRPRKASEVFKILNQVDTYGKK